MSFFAARRFAARARGANVFFSCALLARGARGPATQPKNRHGRVYLFAPRLLTWVGRQPSVCCAGAATKNKKQNQKKHRFPPVRSSGPAVRDGGCVGQNSV